MPESNVNPDAPVGQAEPTKGSETFPESRGLGKLLVCTNGSKVWLKEEADKYIFGRFVAERDEAPGAWQLLCEVQDRCNAFATLADALLKVQAVLGELDEHCTPEDDSRAIGDLMAILDDEDVGHILQAARVQEEGA